MVGKLLNEREQASMRGKALAAARLLLSTPVLVVLYLVGTMFALTLSTVRVISDGPATSGAVRLTALDDTSVTRSGAPPVSRKASRSRLSGTS